MSEATPLIATLYWADEPIFRGTPEEAAVSLPEDARLDPRVLTREGCTEVGPQLVLHIERVAPVSTIAVRDRPDWSYRRAAAISGLMHVFLVGAALVTPPALGLPLDKLHRVYTDYLEVRLTKPEPKPPAPIAPVSSRPGMQRTEDSRVGGRTDARRPRAPVDATQVGLLKHLKAGGGALGRILGGGGLDGLVAAASGLRGATLAAGDGLGGMGTRGRGAGGAGGSYEIGAIRTGGGGPVHVRLGGGGKRAVRVLPGRTVLGEGLDKAQVGRVMRRHLARFRFCYEKQLNANPNLAGKVSVRFMIAPDGRVGQSRIAESTLGSPAVEGCVRRVVQTLRFPAPRGGGVVMVSYPFLFSSVD